MVAIEFVHFDPRLNRFRRYMLSEQVTLFGELDLVIRVGSNRQPVAYADRDFSVPAAFAQCGAELAQLRQRTGTA